MNRRDFLRLGKGKERTLELSCDRLYIRWVDARSGLGATASADDVERDAALWGGEPSLDVTVPTPEQLFAELEQRLAGVQVLRVHGREWLASGDFRREVESSMEAFRRRGGRVE